MTIGNRAIPWKISPLQGEANLAVAQRGGYNNLVCEVCWALYFLVPMLSEQGLGTLPYQRDHLALDVPKAGADLAHLNPGSGCRSGGLRRHLFSHDLRTPADH